MIPADLKPKAENVAAELRKSGGKWETSIADRISKILADGSADTGKIIRDNLSLADFNHLQSRVNVLTALEAGWAAATESWAAPVLAEVREQLKSVQAQQAVIDELVQLGWTFKL